MAMRATTIRFSERLYALLDETAADQGTSRAVYIREAAIARLWADMTRQAHPAAERFDEILRGVSCVGYLGSFRTK